MDFLKHRKGGVVFYVFLLSPLQCTVPSKLLISSGGINFVTPAANFCDHLPGLFHQIEKIFKNIISLK
jgi:hypothetical protein